MPQKRNKGGGGTPANPDPSKPGETLSRPTLRPIGRLPVSEKKFNKLPRDGHNEREFIMKEKFQAWKSKTMLRSRTITTVIVTIMGFALTKFFGLDVDLGTIVSTADGLQLGELILSVGAVVAAFFRKNQRVDFSADKK